MNVNERFCQAFCGAMGVGQRFFTIRHVSLAHPEKKRSQKAYKSVNVHCLYLRNAIEGFLFYLSFNYEAHLNDLVPGVCVT